jgi:hypothetical protein
MVRWRIEPAERYPNGVDGIIEAIHDDLVWVVIASTSILILLTIDDAFNTYIKVNQGATQNLQNAVTFPELSYNGSSAITVFASEARNENA